MGTEEPAPARVLEQEQAIELACSANIDAWCAHRGIPLEKQEDGTFLHEGIPALRIDGASWYRDDQQKGLQGIYYGGTLVEYLIEYEQMDFRQAVEEIIADVAPGTAVRWDDDSVLPEPVPAERCISLSVRAERARALIQSLRAQPRWP